MTDGQKLGAFLDRMMGTQRYKDGEPCDHPGCCSHITHPCEGCGRIGCRSHNQSMHADSEKHGAADGRR